MPATSIRDLVIKDDDIVVGTHGRSFWILDDIASLRQLTSTTDRADATLFKPAAAYRFRWSKYTDYSAARPTEPYGQNPPDGAIIDYHLGANVRGDVTLEIRDPSGRVIRTYSSRDTSMAPADLRQRAGVLDSSQRRCYPRHPDSTGSCGTCTTRRRPGTSTQPGQYPISGTRTDTPREPRGPRAAPGEHSVRLMVGGKNLFAGFYGEDGPARQNAGGDHRADTRHRLSHYVRRHRA
jgi:hypothetical protein